MIGLTHRQAEGYAAIERSLAAGVSPTLAELGAELGISSKGGVHRLLVALRDRGYIEFTKGRSRSIRLASSGTADLHSRTDQQLREIIAAAQAILDRRRNPLADPLTPEWRRKVERAASLSFGAAS